MISKFGSLKVAILLSCLTASSAYAGDMFPENIFITLKGSGQIAQYSGQHTWAGDPVMLYNAITPDGKRLVVSSPKMQSIYVFDTSSHKRLAKIKVGKASKGLKVSPNGKEVYVANEGADSISVVDLRTYKQVATIKTGDMPHNIRFSDDGKLAYVTLQGGAGLGVIDTKLRKVVKVIPVPGIIGPHNLDVTGDGKTFFIRDTAGSVAVLDMTSEKVIKVIKVGAGHAGIDVSGDGEYVFTGAIADNYVTVIDVKRHEVIKKINVGFGPHGVRTSKNGRWLYVVVTADNLMVVIDTKTFSIVKKFDVSDFPFWIAVNGNP